MYSRKNLGLETTKLGLMRLSPQLFRSSGCGRCQGMFELRRDVTTFEFGYSRGHRQYYNNEH